MATTTTVTPEVHTQAVQAAQGLANTLTAGHGDMPTDQTPEQIIDVGINALAALTNTTPAALKERLRITGDVASMSEYQKMMALVAMRQYADEHATDITNNLKPENLAAMDDARRRAVRNFYAQVGADMTAFDTAPEGETPDQRRSREAHALADIAGHNNPFADFFIALFMMIARALGIEDFANSIVNNPTPDNTPTGRAISTSGQAHYGNEAEINAIVSRTQGRGTINGVVSLAHNLLGQHETGENQGAMVRACMGREGLPWCAGFVRYCFDSMGVTGVYDQADYWGAGSYANVASRYGAYHRANSGYTPRAGDVISMSGHVGMITGVDADGTVHYIAGNDGDSVQEHTFNIHNPPAKVLGYCDTHAVASARGIDIDRPRANAPAPAPGRTVN